MPIKSVAEAINEATRQLLAENPNYYVIGEGLSDGKRAFGTVPDVPGRVFDMPVSENGMTGVCIGSAVAGMRPIMVHMRADFLLYAADQIINNAAKWFAMFGGQAGNCPMVIRAVMGRGFGQGYQHAQRLERMFAEIPGLKIVVPSNAYDAKGLLIAAARDNNPVLFFEHRWIHELKCEVPDETYEIPLSKIKAIRQGDDAIITTYGYMVHECVKAAEFLSQQDIEVTIIDLRGPTQAVDGYINIIEDSCCPPAPSLSKHFYHNAATICMKVAKHLGVDKIFDFYPVTEYVNSQLHDVPNPDFVGPF